MGTEPATSQKPGYETRMRLWIDSAKTCAQLATAAMFLPIFYLRELGGIGKDAALSTALTENFFNAWLAWIVAIALAHTYQISAIKLIEEGGNATVFPRVQYWGMVGALVLGALLFANGAKGALSKEWSNANPPLPKVTTPAPAPASQAASKP
jgi:hypothetical protein